MSTNVFICLIFIDIFINLIGLCNFSIEDMETGFNPIRVYKEYNVNLSVDHLTEQYNDYMSLVIFYDKNDNEIFNLKIAHDISMLMYDIKNQKFFVINVNDLQQLYVKEKETELFRD